MEYTFDVRLGATPTSDVQAWDSTKGRWINAIQWPYPKGYDRLTTVSEDDILLRVRNTSTIRVITGDRTDETVNNLPTDGRWTEVTIPKNLVTWSDGFTVSVFRGSEPFRDANQFDIHVRHTQPVARISLGKSVGIRLESR